MGVSLASTVTADALAPQGARASAGTVLIPKLDISFKIPLTINNVRKHFKDEKPFF